MWHLVIWNPNLGYDMDIWWMLNMRPSSQENLTLKGRYSEVMSYGCAWVYGDHVKRVNEVLWLSLHTNLPPQSYNYFCEKKKGKKWWIGCLNYHFFTLQNEQSINERVFFCSGTIFCTNFFWLSPNWQLKTPVLSVNNLRAARNCSAPDLQVALQRYLCCNPGRQSWLSIMIGNPDGQS